MRVVKLLFFLSALVLRSTYGSEEDERIKSIYTKCKDETQLEDTLSFPTHPMITKFLSKIVLWVFNMYELDVFKKMELPTSQKGKCMMGCLMREAGIIVNGKFDKGGALKVAEKYYSDKQEDLEKARAVVDVCEKQLENETEECNIASRLATCVLEEAQKAGLTSIPQG